MIERRGLTAGQVRERTGVTRARLKYWETMGIVAPSREEHHTRTWRIYSTADADKIRRLLWLLKNGMTLSGAISKLPLVEQRENSGKRAGEPTAATGEQVHAT